MTHFDPATVKRVTDAIRARLGDDSAGDLAASLPPGLADLVPTIGVIDCLLTLAAHMTDDLADATSRTPADVLGIWASAHTGPGTKG